MSELWQDVRFGARMLLRSPGFTLVAVLTLALGIGANTAIFSVVAGVLLRPLPYPEPGQLVSVYTVFPTQPKFSMSVADFKDYMDRNTVFSNAALYAQDDLDLTIDGIPRHLSGMGVSSGYFQVLGYKPALGRDFAASDNYKSNGHTAILSDQLWRNRFGADPNVVGRSVTLSGDSYTIIGVMPPGIEHVGGNYRSVGQGPTVDLWAAVQIWPSKLDGCDRGCHFLNMIARMKPGVSVEQASAEMNTLAGVLAATYPGNKGGRILLAPLKEEVVGQARQMLVVLMASTGFLLLIACVNVANLSLARATSRHREITMRSVLGAGNFRIVRQLLTESLLLSFVGCSLGLLLANVGVEVLVALAPANFPRLHTVHIDWRVLLFAIFVTVLTAALFGLAPAISTVRLRASGSLKDGERGTTSGAGRARLRDILAAAEIAIALVVLVGAGLLARTFLNLQRVHAGFEADHVLTFRLDMPFARYKDDAKYIRFFQELTARLESLPGVRAVGVSSDIPWTNYDENAYVTLEGPSDPASATGEARYHFVSPDYFRAIRTPLLSGRFFTAADDAKAPRVLLVNEAFATKYYPGGDAVGKHVQGFNDQHMQIVGVVGDVSDTPMALQAKPAFYANDWQATGGGERVIAIRSDSNLSALEKQVPSEVAALDPDLPVLKVMPMDQVSAEAISSTRFTLLLVGSFAGLALILAVFGIFGVVSYSVSQRTHEFGIRLALGALQKDLLEMVISKGVKLAMIGVACGLAAALALTRAMASLLFGVSPYDPWTLGLVAAALALVTLAACYIPARRASNVDPMVALRYE